MFQPKAAFSGFSVDDLEEAKAFYGETLGLSLENEKMGLEFNLPGGGKIFVYSKDDHRPAAYTILNFVVDDIDSAANDLSMKGVSFERYEGIGQDEKGIARGLENGRGPSIAWFKDPAGNILSILQPDK